MSWIDEKGPEKDVVLSSRIRIARNLEDSPFPSILDQDHANHVLNEVYKSVYHGNSVIGRDFRCYDLKDVNPVDRTVMIEKHLASSDLMKHPEISAIYLDTKDYVSIMVNEEDHVRLQCILPGLQLDKAWDYIDKVDDCLEENLRFAFDDELGYLTSCPTNVGTGLRASVMAHLPALTMTNNLNSILQTISKIGLTTRGIYGEGSEALGYIYQISNQVTLGLTEREIISNLTVVVRQIIDKEREARHAMLNANKIEFEDSISRSFGILAYAMKLDLKEFMSLISQVRMGVTLGLIKNPTLEEIDELIIQCQAGGIQKSLKKELIPEEIAIERANRVRRAFANY